MEPVQSPAGAAVPVPGERPCAPTPPKPLRPGCVARAGYGPRGRSARRHSGEAIRTVNRLYPVFLKLAGRPVLVVGGGPVAWRRIEGLLASCARVTVVSLDAVPALEQAAAADRLTWHRRAFTAADADGAALVFSAAGDEVVLRAVREAATARGILLSAAEDEARGDLQIPATAARGEVKIAVS